MLYSAEERKYDKEEIEFILALAEIGGIAITNTKFYQRLKNDIRFWESTLTYLDSIGNPIFKPIKLAQSM